MLKLKSLFYGLFSFAAFISLKVFHRNFILVVKKAEKNSILFRRNYMLVELKTKFPI